MVTDAHTVSNMFASLCRTSTSASCSAGSCGAAVVTEGSVVIEVAGEESSEVMVEESVEVVTGSGVDVESSVVAELKVCGAVVGRSPT